MSEHDHDAPHTPEEHVAALHEHDDWFRHSPDEPHHQQSHGEFNPVVVVGFLAATILTVVVVSAVVIWWFGGNVFERKRGVQESDVNVRQNVRDSYDQLSPAWVNQLTGAPRWVNEQENTITVPIDTAIDIVVERYAEGR